MDITFFVYTSLQWSSRLRCHPVVAKLLVTFISSVSTGLSLTPAIKKLCLLLFVSETHCLLVFCGNYRATRSFGLLPCLTYVA